MRRRVSREQPLDASQSILSSRGNPRLTDGMHAYLQSGATCLHLASCLVLSC